MNNLNYKGKAVLEMKILEHMLKNDGEVCMQPEEIADICVGVMLMTELLKRFGISVLLTNVDRSFFFEPDLPENEPVGLDGIIDELNDILSRHP
jgi:hypothetical protein